MTKAAVMRMALKMQRLKLKGRFLKLEALTTAPGTDDDYLARSSFLAIHPSLTLFLCPHSPYGPTPNRLMITERSRGKRMRRNRC